MTRSTIKSLTKPGRVPFFCPNCGQAMRNRKRHDISTPTIPQNTAAKLPAIARQAAEPGAQLLMLQANDEKRYTLSVVQTPDEPTYPTIVNAKGQKEVWEVTYPADVVQNMAHTFALDGNFGAIGLMHQECPPDASQPINKPKGEHGQVVESFVAPWSGSIVDPSGEQRYIKQGSWLVGIIWKEDVWPRVRSGELGALSLATDSFEIEAVD